MLGQVLETLSGHWAVHLESRVPRTELYEARIASSKPSLGFFHSSDQLCGDNRNRAWTDRQNALSGLMDDFFWLI